MHLLSILTFGVFELSGWTLTCRGEGDIFDGRVGVEVLFIVTAEVSRAVVMVGIVVAAAAVELVVVVKSFMGPSGLVDIFDGVVLDGFPVVCRVLVSR